MATGWVSEESAAAKGGMEIRIEAPGEKSDAQRQIRVLLADEQAVFRKGLMAVLGGMPDLEVVAEAGDGLEATRLARLLQPDLEGLLYAEA